MKHIHSLITVMTILMLSSCDLKTAPVIGGFFPTDTPTRSVDGTVTSVHWQTDVPVQEIQAIVIRMKRAARQMLREQIRSALTSLADREREVLEMRFGLLDGQDHTLEEVSRFFDVTRERIRQIEAKALRKLRHPSRSRELRDYLP